MEKIEFVMAVAKKEENIAEDELRGAGAARHKPHAMSEAAGEAELGTEEAYGVPGEPEGKQAGTGTIAVPSSEPVEHADESNRVWSIDFQRCEPLTVTTTRASTGCDW